MNDVGCSVSFDTPDIYAYLYNSRSELTNATAAVDSAYCYGYDFDDISNRESSSERGTNITYAANSLNQYTALNQTFEHSEHSEHSNISPVSMSFDRMGRRVTKNDQRFVYNGYLQVGNFHCSPSPSAFTSTFIWDPTEPVATRPLVWKRGTSVAYYTHDGNKNVSEVIAVDGSVAAHYEYAPFGALTVSRGTFAAANPFLFSSEYAEDDTATVYYNYRHYEPVMGRWLGRDPIGEADGLCLYTIVHNNCSFLLDVLGLCCCGDCQIKNFSYVGPVIVGFRLFSGAEKSFAEISFDELVNKIDEFAVDKFVENNSDFLMKAIYAEVKNFVSKKNNLETMLSMCVSTGLLIRPELEIATVVRYRRRDCISKWWKFGLGSCSWSSWNLVVDKQSEWVAPKEECYSESMFDVASIVKNPAKVLGKIIEGLENIVNSIDDVYEFDEDEYKNKFGCESEDWQNK